MIGTKTLKICSLANSLEAKVTDITCHYFGGFYHVRLRITVDVPINEKWFSNREEYLDANNRLSHSLCFSRILEKMAVPENDVEEVRQTLLNSFECNMLPYLSLEHFPSSFALKEYKTTLAKSSKSTFLHS